MCCCGFMKINLLPKRLGEQTFNAQTEKRKMQCENCKEKEALDNLQLEGKHLCRECFEEEVESFLSIQ